MLNNNRIYCLLAVILPFLFSLIVSGCCSPNVENSILSPEAKNIQAWLVELAEDSTAVDAGLIIDNLRADIKSKYTKTEYCAPYLGRVEDGLRARGYHLVNGPVTEGTIRIDIEGHKEHFWIIRIGYEDDWKEELEWDSRGDPTGGHLGGEEIMVDASKLVQEDEVKAVQIEFFDFNGKSLGQVGISGCTVKPEFIAKVIDKMIKEGRY